MSQDGRRTIVRLSDVAKLAQCSAATVSRVLNAPETVNLEARLRVEAAVRDLGYMRNGAARALRSRRTQIVGVILPTLKQPIYADFVGTLQDTLARRDYALIVTSHEYSLDRELFQARLLAERGVDGLVLIGHTHRSGLGTLMRIQGLPYVTTYTFKPRLRHPAVGFNNFAAMGQVAEFLYGLGHRRFAMLAGSARDNDRVEERVAGALAALAARDIILPADRIMEEAFTIEGGRSGLRRLMESGDPPTALICTSDILAYGALIECGSRGIAVPGDLSVVGFDDLDASAHVTPALTTMAIPCEEMGRRAGDYLLARFAGQPVSDQIPIETHLVERDSTSPPRGRSDAALW